jgi:hypothetical protein
MVLNPSWEAANCVATQELSSILRNPKISYRFHKSSPLVPILSQTDPVHTIPSYLSEINLLLSTHLSLGLPSGLFPYGFLTNILHAFLFSPFVQHTLPISSYFPYLKEIQLGLWDHLAVCVCESPCPLPSNFECLNQSLFSLLCVSWHLSSSQRRTS